MASERGQSIISYAYTSNKNGTGRQSCYRLHISEKNKHNRMFLGFQRQLMTPLHCCVWKTCILNPKVLSKMLASGAHTVSSSIKGSLSNPRESQCDLLNNTVAWNCIDFVNPSSAISWLRWPWVHHLSLQSFYFCVKMETLTVTSFLKNLTIYWLRCLR